MPEYAFPCFVCSKEMKNVEEIAYNQPWGGTVFRSHGNFGSTVFDPGFSETHVSLEINICDDCLVRLKANVRQVEKLTPMPPMNMVEVKQWEP